MLKLTIKDMKILRELDFDARQPMAKIARKVGLSPEVTAYRIKQLEKKGIITGYYPVIDLSKLGYMFVRIVLTLERMSPTIEQQFLDYPKQNKNIGWVLLCDNWRVVLVGYAKTIQEAKTLSDDITFAFNTIIREKYLSLATRIYHFRRKYLYSEVDDRQLLWGEEGSMVIDSIDKKIMAFLTKDARAAATQIAQKAGLTSMAVINRIRKMEKSGLIQGYRCSLNLEKLGYTHVKIQLYAENLSKQKKRSLIEFIKRWKHSVYITEAFGKADLEFECHVPTLYLVEEFMKKVRTAYPEVKSYENMIHYKENISRYIPEKF